MTDLCIDLCSGLGGFSQAFVDAGWEVLRVENDERFKEVPFTWVSPLGVLALNALECIEVRTRLMHFADYDKVVVVSSPPCERFSLGNRMFPKVGVAQALSTVGRCLELIAEIRESREGKPTYWVLENPRGRLRWFIGKPTSSIRLSDYGSKYLKPTDLWHNVLFPQITGQRPYEPSWSSTKNAGKGSTGLLRLRDPAKRAEMPYGLSQAILEAVKAPASSAERPQSAEGAK